MGEPVLTTGADVWRSLRDVLEPRSWDEDLEAALRATLALPQDVPLADALDHARIDADAFIRAFFGLARPYLAMWDALLSMMQRAGATTGTAAIRIDYHFGDGPDPDVSFDMDHFRRAAEVVTRAMAPFDLRSVDEPWRLLQLLDRRKWPAELTEWLEPYWTDAPWPTAVPVPPPAADPVVGDRMRELWNLAAHVLAEARSISGSRRELMELPEDAPDAVGGTPGSLLRYAEGDMWVGNLLVGAHSLAAHGADADADKLQAIDAELARYRNADQSLTALYRHLRDFLELPLWRYRHELFANWVCTRVIDALEDRAPRLHVSPGGVLAFRFSGTHLATFDGFEPRLHLFTELRSAHPAPVGRSRKRAIQPDISLVFDPVTDVVTSPLAVECKQYLKAAVRDFAYALTDYATGRPAARVVLADHGPVDEERVRQRVPEAVRERTHVVGSLRPDDQAALDRFRALVQAAVPAAPEPPAAGATAPTGVAEPVARVTLAWLATSRDLDLHVIVRVAGRPPHEVSWQAKGAVEKPPFCVLDRDDTTGPGLETVTIAQWAPDASYDIVVRPYSPGAVAEGAAVFIWTEEGGLTRHRCPPGVVGDWPVATLYAPGGHG